VDGSAKDAAVAATLPENYKDKSNQAVIISAAIVGAVAILIIIATVIITGTGAEQAPESALVNVPPVTMFPPSPSVSLAPPASESGSSIMQDKTAVQDGSARNLDFDDAKEGDEAVHATELI